MLNNKVLFNLIDFFKKLNQSLILKKYLTKRIYTYSTNSHSNFKFNKKDKCSERGLSEWSFENESVFDTPDISEDESSLNILSNENLIFPLFKKKRHKTFFS